MLPCFAAAKVATALKLSEDDDTTIDSLKKQIEKAWTMVEAYHEKELRANETITRLKGEIANLTTILEKQTGITGRDNTLDELLKVRVCVCSEGRRSVLSCCSTPSQTVFMQPVCVDNAKHSVLTGACVWLGSAWAPVFTNVTHRVLFLWSQVREVLTRRNEDAAATIQRMQADMDEVIAKVEHKRQKNKEKKALLADLRDQSKAKDVELEREVKKKERIDREMKVRAAWLVHHQ